MAVLGSLLPNHLSDKQTIHSYLPTYETLLHTKRESVRHVLEIGVRQGGQLQMWHEYFPNAQIHGADFVAGEGAQLDYLARYPRVQLHMGQHPYQHKFDRVPEGFDLVIDNGSHTLQSMFECLQCYLPQMNAHALLVIESVQNVQWLHLLRDFVQARLGHGAHVVAFDLRHIKRRYDDLLFVVDFSRTCKDQWPRSLDLPTQLEELLWNSHSDKNTSHSYLPYYQELLNPRRLSARHVLEVGVCMGGSMLLWNNFFTNATIYGPDIEPKHKTWPLLRYLPRVKLYEERDAYTQPFVDAEFKDIQFDVVIDDGPHNLCSMLDFLELYIPKMAEDGILIIEDIQDMKWLKHLKNAVPKELQKHVRTYDLRLNKNRFDDILFVLDKCCVFDSTTNHVVPPLPDVRVIAVASVLFPLRLKTIAQTLRNMKSQSTPPEEIKVYVDAQIEAELKLEEDVWYNESVCERVAIPKDAVVSAELPLLYKALHDFQSDTDVYVIWGDVYTYHHMFIEELLEAHKLKPHAALGFEGVGDKVQLIEAETISGVEARPFAKVSKLCLRRGILVPAKHIRPDYPDGCFSLPEYLHKKGVEQFVVKTHYPRNMYSSNPDERRNYDEL